MRLVVSALLALALGMLPVGTARAQTMPTAPVSAMSCHDMINAGHAMGGDETPSGDRKQHCADHCLSQVNGQTSLTRLLGPSLQNAIRAELGASIDHGKLHYRDPPDPPPPRL